MTTKWGLTLVLTLVVASGGHLKASAGSEGIAVTMKSGRGGERLLEGRFRVAAPAEIVRTVLVDFERLPSFVSSVRSSRIVSRGDRFSVVEQVMKGRIGPFRKTIFLRLEVYETPTSISFRDVSKRSFKTYEGSWGLIDQGDEIEVVYELRGAPAFYSPAALTGNAFRSSVKTLLGEIKNEIEARSSQ